VIWLGRSISEKLFDREESVLQGAARRYPCLEAERVRDPILRNARVLSWGAGESAAGGRLLHLLNVVGAVDVCVVVSRCELGFRGEG